MIRVGVNALYLIPGRVGGTEIYLRNVLQALSETDQDNEYVVIRNRETGSDLIPATENFRDLPQSVRGESRPARLLYEQAVLPFLARRHRLDVLFNAGFTAPLLCPCPMVTVFHDLQYRLHPEYFRWFDLPFWRMLLPASASRSKRIVVLSEAVKADVVRFLNFAAARIDVIPHGVEPEFSRIAERRSSHLHKTNLILSVSTLHPHKNLDGLLKAFARFVQNAPGWRLVIAGVKGFEAERIEALQRTLGLTESVEITGWIAREELYKLFESAEAFVYPSRFEGFGIPVLEAITAGIPTACSDLPSLHEIAGDAVRYFDPDSTDDIVAALTEITTGETRPAARARSWHDGARKLVSVFELAARDPFEKCP